MCGKVSWTCSISNAIVGKIACVYVDALKRVRKVIKSPMQVPLVERVLDARTRIGPASTVTLRLVTVLDHYKSFPFLNIYPQV